MTKNNDSRENAEGYYQPRRRGTNLSDENPSARQRQVYDIEISYRSGRYGHYGGLDNGHSGKRNLGGND